ncbi:MAG: hypothetical protein MZV70_01200 [Desulfobacterales bacterium]|nr:hypothetical protein [Desulfobacterales bacterium]
MMSELVINVTHEERQGGPPRGRPGRRALHRAHAGCQPRRKYLQGQGPEDPAGHAIGLCRCRPREGGLSSTSPTS